MKRLLVILFVAFFILPVKQASAAREFRVCSSALFGCGQLFNPPTCDTLLEIASVKSKSPITCSGLDAAVKQGTYGQFNVTTKDGGKFLVSLDVTGACTEGKDAGSFSIPIAYTLPANHEVNLQLIHDPIGATATAGGCVIKGVELGGCFWHEPANGASLKECLVYFKETGANGGEEAPPDTSAPDYSGTGSGGGTGGGGTDPGSGGGGTGDGGTGGGGTGGGGTGGGGTGGGGTGGGGTGGGGTGGGGTGGGDTQQNCGAPGQPACKIDETGTPTGEGLFNELMKLVDGIGKDREKGLADAQSKDDKDTSLPFKGIDLPAGECVNPTVTIPFNAGVWSVPICGYLDMLRPLFTAFFAISFVLAAISMVARATSKS